MVLRLWRTSPQAPDVFDTTSDCAFHVSAAIPPAGRLPRPAVPGEEGGGGTGDRYHWDKDRRDASARGNLFLSLSRKNYSQSCTLAAISICRVLITLTQPHMVTWYHIRNSRLITQLTLEMDWSRAQETDLPNVVMILPSGLPTLVLLKSDGDNRVYFSSCDVTNQFVECVLKPWAWYYESFVGAAALTFLDTVLS